MQFQRRADHDNRTARVIDALAEQVLTETPLLALDHVGQRFQRALVGAGNSAAAAAVVEQCVNRLLQHALFVAHDDIRRIQLEQALETIVTIDDATVEIIQIRGRETTAIERYQRAQIRRQYRQYGHDHPLRTIARIDESLDQLETLGKPLELGFRLGAVDLFAQVLRFVVEIHVLQQFVNGLGAHLGVEIVAELLDRFEVRFVGQQLALFERGHARIDDHETFEVKDPFNITQGHVQQQADA